MTKLYYVSECCSMRATIATPDKAQALKEQAYFVSQLGSSCPVCGGERLKLCKVGG